MAVFYPAKVDAATKPMAVPFFKHLELYRDAELAPGGEKRAGHVLARTRQQSDAICVVRTNRGAKRIYRSGALSLARQQQEIRQARPIDIGLDIDFLLADPVWSEQIDPGRIGVAGHSQGDFTSLWLGGAKVNAEKYLAFQQGWRNNQSIPKHLREALPLDARGLQGRARRRPCGDPRLRRQGCARVLRPDPAEIDPASSPGGRTEPPRYWRESRMRAATRPRHGRRGRSPLRPLRRHPATTSTRRVPTTG